MKKTSQEVSTTQLQPRNSQPLDRGYLCLDITIETSTFPSESVTADISKMYTAVELADQDRDLHRFVWRHNPQEPLLDYRMARLTFSISASAYAANTSVKQNALDLALEFPQAAKVVEQSFYVDDCLIGSDTVEEAVKLQMHLHDLLSRGGFLLHKWTSSDPAILQNVPNELKDSQAVLSISDSDHQYVKTLGEWNTSTYQFCLMVFIQ